MSAFKTLKKICFLMVMFGSGALQSVGQSQFMKTYTFSSNDIGSYVFDGEGQDKLIDQRQNGFIMGMPVAFIPEPYDSHQIRIQMTDATGEFTGVSKKYDVENDVKDLHLIALSNGDVDDGFFMLGRTEDTDENYFIRCNNLGGVDWSKKINLQDDAGEFHEMKNLVALQAENGDIVIAGSFVHDFDGFTALHELVFMKLDNSSGNLILLRTIQSDELDNGFRVSDIFEKDANEFFIAGSRFALSSAFVARINSPVGGFSVNVRAFDLTSIADITTDYQSLVIAGSHDNWGETGETFLFRIDDNLSNVRSLDNTPGQMDVYTGGAATDIITHNDRFIIAGYEYPDPGSTRFVATISNDGELVNEHKYSDPGFLFHTLHGQTLFDSDLSIFVGDAIINSPGSSIQGVALRLSTFALDGESCDIAPYSLVHTQQPIINGPISFSIGGRSNNFDDLGVMPNDDAIVKEDQCTDCFVTAADFGPITTSVGPLSLCGASEIDLIAPPGFVEWQWFKTGLLMGEAATLTITEAGLYHLVGTDADGCAVELEIEILPGIDESLMSETMFCIGSSTTLPSLSGMGGWSGPFIISTATDHTFVPTTTGTFVLTYTDTETGCESTFSVEVTQSEFAVSSIPSCSGVSNGSIAVSSADGSLYNWGIAGGTTGSIVGEATATFEGLSAGTYTITGTMVAAPFCSSEQIVTVTETDASWPKTTSNAWGRDHATDVGNDADGNIYMVGDFVTETTFDGLTVNDPSISTQAAFTASYDQCGDLRWVAIAEGKKVSIARMAVYKELERIYVIGSFDGITTFRHGETEAGTYPCGSATTVIGTTYEQGAFVAVYSTEGCLLHVREFLGSPGTLKEGEAIAASSFEDPSTGVSHRIYFAIKTTVFSSSSEIGVRIYAMTPNPAFPYDFAYEWSDGMLSHEFLEVNDMEAINGHIAITGAFSKELIHAPTSTLTSPSNKKDAFVYHWYDADDMREVKFEKDLYSEEPSYMHGIAHTLTLEPSQIIIGGEYIGNVAGAFSGPNLLAPFLAAEGAFVANLDFEGGTNWIRSISGSKSASVKSLDSEDDKLFVGGEFLGNELYESTSLAATAPLMYHTFVTSWSVSSGPIGGWANIGTGGNSPAYAPINEGLTYVNDHVYLGGDYVGNMDFAMASPGIGPLNSTGPFKRNAYLWRFGAPLGEAKSAIVSIEDEVQHSELNLYPNPTNGKLFLEVAEADQIWQYEVRSMLGQVIQKGTLSARGEINLQNQQTGMYLVVLQSGDQREIRKILLK